VRDTARAIPLARPFLDGREEELVLEVLRSGRLSLGPATERFEQLVGERVGAPYAAAVSSGTTGLHLLTHLAGVGPGDEAITSPFSFVSSANCFLYEGATPVFADIDRLTLNLDPEAVEAAITERTRLIVTVDVFGYPCELDELRAIADRHGVALVEDSAEALGAEYKGKPLGAHGTPAIFAFYPNNQMTTGEGGVITTHDEQQWRLLDSLRNQGRSDTGGWLAHARLGWNYRMDELSAAMGVGQLEKLDLLLSMRAEVASRYDDFLAPVEGIEMPVADDVDHRRSWFVYVVILPESVDREDVIADLAAEGIDTSRYFPVIHLQPYMRERFGFTEGLCPVAEEVSRRTLALPFYPQLEAEDQERVVAALSKAVGS
jgi:perosamine synthetase